MARTKTDPEAQMRHEGNYDAVEAAVTAIQGMCDYDKVPMEEVHRRYKLMRKVCEQTILPYGEEEGITKMRLWLRNLR